MNNQENSQHRGGIVAFALFLVQVVVISLTGVMAPGPITAVTVGTGTRSPHAGALIAIGHGIVEFPLMALIWWGLGDVLREPAVKTVIFSFGGAFLVYLGIGLLRSVRNAAEPVAGMAAYPLTAGIALSLGNVYFLIWWATVGASLITRAVTFGLGGVLLFALIHWMCDFGWLYTLSTVSHRGGQQFGVRFRQIVNIVSGIALVVFGAMFLFDAAGLWRSGV
jgi:threonine/homoserine/homoserine lactone efflux protein